MLSPNSDLLHCGVWNDLCSLQSDRHTKWTTCLLSGQPLAVPIAADWLGRLYNRCITEYTAGPLTV